MAPRPLLYCAIIATLAVSSTAAAQSPQADGGAAKIEEVVVTARKREESLQRTPISVTAFTGAALAEHGMSSTTDLGNHVPNLVANSGSAITGAGSAASYFIRGIGQVDFTLNTDPGVGLYVDDVYIARTIGAAMDLLDLRSVEVLRGPQGTLFGRNTIGGAISLHSQPPSAQAAAKALLELGSDNLNHATVSANLPLSETLLTRVSASYRKQDGFVKRLIDGVDVGETNGLAARIATRWMPSDVVTADLVLDGSRHRGESVPSRVTALNGASLFGSFHNAVVSGSAQCLPPPGSLTNPACFNSQFLPRDPYTTNATGPYRSDLDAWGAALTVAVEPGQRLRIKSITAYRSTQSHGFLDGDGSPHVIIESEDIWDHEQLSQELQFAGTAAGSSLDWIVGLYYFEEQGSNINPIIFSAIANQSGGAVDNDSAALFGQTTWHATDALSITAGLRYTDETRRFAPDQFVVEDRNPDPALRLPPGFPLLPPGEVETSASELTPHLNVAYEWSDDFMTYATYSQGFKSGGFTQRVFPPLPAAPAFKPELVDSYEVGTKITGFDQRLRVNAAAFYTDYTDVQVLTQVGVSPTTQNAAEAEIRGFELELTALPASGLRIDAGIGYTDAKYTSIGPQVIGLTLQSKFARIPQWTGNASVQYRLGFTGGASLTPRVDWTYRSDMFMDAGNLPQLHQPSYSLLGASLSWLSADEHWEARLAGTNLTDEAYFTSGFGDLPVSGVAEVVMARPRQWSLQLQYQY